MSKTVTYTLNPHLQESFDDILSTLAGFRSKITEVQNKVRDLERNVTKDMKQMDKKINKNKFKGNKNPSGFAKPSKISEPLCKFMELPNGSEVARTEVTQYLINYIEKENLQNPDNKKIIVPNKELQSLLGSNPDDEISYFNIQKYMNKHFQKDEKLKHK
tara:strand:- start:1240 stop:1719 length:480 start_codon:yes stop_codon:yes gene_type:complete